MGKYEWGSWGASGARSGRQVLYALGGTGGRLVSENALRADESVARASVSSTAGCSAVREVTMPSVGAAMLKRGLVEA